MTYVPGLLAGAVCALSLSNQGCSAASTIADAAQGCDEFNGGETSVASLSIDADTKAFLTASTNLQVVATELETTVTAARIAIDTDMGVADTWSAKTSPDDKLNEACAQAKTIISGTLSANASAQCQLSISAGHCEVDANIQASCQGNCSVMGSCTPPDIMAACDPGQITGECSAMCNASATCEGSVNVAANCQGACEADCSGECDVTATAPSIHCEGTCAGKCTGTCDGSTSLGAACAGMCKGECDAKCTVAGGVKAHCEGSCKGTCTGSCKLDANAMVSCGAMVNCKGGCSVAYTAPKCEAKITPPDCMASASCKASCQSSAEVKAVCTPPAAELQCSASASADVTKLVASIEKNFPALLAAVQTKGKLAIDAAGQVGTTGSAVVNTVTSIGGKALACAAVGVQASVKASASVNVSVMASASVSGSAGGPSS